MTLNVEPLKVSHHPTMFGGHRHCGNGDITALLFQLISQNHLMKPLSVLMGRRPSRQVSIHQSLVAIAAQVVEP